jgi:hypothetical protein
MNDHLVSRPGPRANAVPPVRLLVVAIAALLFAPPGEAAVLAQTLLRCALRAQLIAAGVDDANPGVRRNDVLDRGEPLVFVSSYGFLPGATLVPSVDQTTHLFEGVRTVVHLQPQHDIVVEPDAHSFSDNQDGG